jgi:hypothetical protein
MLGLLVLAPTIPGPSKNVPFFSLTLFYSMDFFKTSDGFLMDSNGMSSIIKYKYSM